MYFPQRLIYMMLIIDFATLQMAHHKFKTFTI